MHWKTEPEPYVCCVYARCWTIYKWFKYNVAPKPHCGMVATAAAAAAVVLWDNQLYLVFLVEATTCTSLHHLTTAMAPTMTVKILCCAFLFNIVSKLQQFQIYQKHFFLLDYLYTTNISAFHLIAKSTKSNCAFGEVNWNTRKYFKYFKYSINKFKVERKKLQTNIVIE